jgi:uncharacterized phage infection (PIP) family protein YhgE
MHWFNNLLAAFTGSTVDVDALKQRLYANNATDQLSNAELEAYVDDIEERVKKMVKALKTMYKKYDITFSGFKSFEQACEYLRESIADGSERAYNNLIKLESAVTSEQKRHLGLIRMAITTDGKKVIDKINNDPSDKQTFVKIFGDRAQPGAMSQDGEYQQLWSEIHKLSEYILLHKNRVYH